MKTPYRNPWQYDVMAQADGSYAVVNTCHNRVVTTRPTEAKAKAFIRYLKQKTGGATPVLGYKHFEQKELTQ